MLDLPPQHNLLQQLERALDRLTPRTLPAAQTQASVLVALTDNPTDPEVILTRRASRLSSHGGEVALPGGKQDEADSSLLHTALRESQEEIGLDPAAVRVVAQLGQVVSKHGLLVTPWVGVVPEDVPLTPNPDELESLFRVPLRFFLADRRLRTDCLHHKGRQLHVPSYRYRGYTIWGLTAYILVELLNLGLGASIPLRPRPELIGNKEAPL